MKGCSMKLRKKREQARAAEDSSSRISQLRKRFMLIFMLAFVIVMGSTGGLINFAFNQATRNQMNEILDELIENEGVLNAEEEDSYDSKSSTFLDQFNYGMRYFTVIIDEDSGELTFNLDHVTLMDEETAQAYAKEALDNHISYGIVDLFESGVVNDYYYKIAQLEDGRTIIAFVNSSIQSHIADRVVLYTIFICAFGLVLTGLVAWKISKSAIRSELEAYNRQKAFITNASHELKTPLAVIRANTEILELTTGENEWTESTLRQVEHMNGLIQNLVMISRAAENKGNGPVQELNFSEVVKSVVEPFKSVAMQDKKELNLDLEEDAVISADESTIRQLVSILTDNAIKYCDPEGRIDVKLNKGKRGKTVILTVSNDYKDGENVDCSRFFDRFYREDSAHENQQGYGIGLSMAESICKQYKGKISAEWKEGVISFICVLRVQ